MDGLLKPEFALVLKDSLNATPRRHVVTTSTSPPPPPPSIPSSTKKSTCSSTEFRLPYNMQLEPRLHFTPFPTSPTSPLPTNTLFESCIQQKDHSKVSTPIRKSSSITKQLSSNLTSSSLPLDVLASVSIEQRENKPISTPRQSILKNTSLPTSPIALEPLTNRMMKSPNTKSNKSPGKSNNSGKTFQCSLCKSSFSQQFNLNKHIRAVHERRRPFECEICHARFQQKSHRNMHHLAVHEKLRQFACDQCDASFSWRGVLKKHRKSIHGIDD